METVESRSASAGLVDRLWRAYAPFQRGRNTFGDLTSMATILLLAGFVEAVGEPEDEFVKRWARATAEAQIGISPLMDLHAALRSASRHPRFPLPDINRLDVELLDGSGGSDDVPWAAAFLAALTQRPALADASLAEICDLLLERHVQEGAFLAGEFHTPQSVARLLVETAAPQPGDRILDPACGAGSVLAAAVKRIAEHGRADGASLEAYATDRSNPRLAMMNLAIHGVDQPVVGASDPVSLYQHQGSGLVDRVVSNPPFNQRIKAVHAVGWPFGEPPEFNANFAWLQLAWSRLSEKGLAAVVMPPGAAWSSGQEAMIRKNMLAGGALMAVIALPANLFAPYTAIPVHVWVLARNKAHHLPVGDAESVLFIDASSLGTQVPRQRCTLTAEDTGRISERFHAWRLSPLATPDEVGFSRSVSHDEIVHNDGSLDPRRYIQVEQQLQTMAPDVGRMRDDLDRHGVATSHSSRAVQEGLSVCERLTRRGFEPPRVSLRSMVNGTPADWFEEDRFEEPMSGLIFAGPSGSLIRAENYVDDGVPVVMPKDLTSNSFSTASIKHVTHRQADELERFRLHLGDVVLARRGELGRCAVVREEQQGWLCGTGCFVLRPPAELDADYFAAYLRTSEARQWLEANSTGSMTMKTISLNALNELPVPLPDLGVQQAIADAMRQLDEHERRLQEQLALTQQIRRDSLTGLLRG
ncbi:type I restriction endonuclease subunit M [Streptomyces noursei]|uniref:Type I restriction endonuclease subunit M n=2 Tax=Streptomyces noursei TaxID=1971 RepID=A0A401R4J1_STRNR|nr:type I restriction endonuclease subunit M [Streptomyces noursei]